MLKIPQCYRALMDVREFRLVEKRREKTLLERLLLSSDQGRVEVYQSNAFWMSFSGDPEYMIVRIGPLHDRETGFAPANVLGFITGLDPLDWTVTSKTGIQYDEEKVARALDREYERVGALLRKGAYEAKRSDLLRHERKENQRFWARVENEIEKKH